MSHSKQSVAQTEAEEVNPIHLPFRSSEERLGLETAYIIGMILRYVRRFQARLLNDVGTLDPSHTSSFELLELSGITTDIPAKTWLDTIHVPEIDDLYRRILGVEFMLEQKIESSLESGLSEYMIPEKIQTQFQLDTLEKHLLCAIAAPQMNMKIARAYRFATGLDSTIFPAGFYAELLSSPEVSVKDVLNCLSPKRNLRRYGLVEVGQQTDWGDKTPILHAPLLVPNRIAAYLFDNHHDEFPSFMTLKKAPSHSITLSGDFRTDLIKLMRKPKLRLGITGAMCDSAIDFIHQNLPSPVLEIDMPALLQCKNQNIKMDDLAIQWFQEACLQSAILIFNCKNTKPQDYTEAFNNAFGMLHEHIRVYPGIVVFTAQITTPMWTEVFTPFTEFVTPSPRWSQQNVFWRDALQGRIPDDRLEEVVSYISSSYCLSPFEIEETILSTVARTGCSFASLTGQMLSDTLCASKGRELEGLADYRNTSLGLDDIVLSEDARKTIDEILNYAKYSETIYQNWGFEHMSSATGLCALFYGPPGTGKTLTAGVIAHELRRALYVVDISKIIDKYIGETEKRLAKIFDHAQQSQAILLFDEADSLFAKRTGVKSSNDRYANLEVNYLLQRLETFRGVSILTTNLATSLDEALSRRIQFKLSFPTPQPEERAQLWKCLIPRHAPHDDIDFKVLGEYFEMSGGHIKNAVFRACVEAAATHSHLTTDMLWKAAVHEYRELGRIIRDQSQPPSNA